MSFRDIECFTFSRKMNIMNKKKKETAGLGDVMIRSWQPSDVPDLREIFCVSFGDPPEIAEAFHHRFLTAPEACLLAAVPEENRPEGRPAAAAYCLPGPVLSAGGRRVSSVYLYAFACLPAWRGRGIMKQVYTALFEDACRRAPALCIAPASEGLLQAYNRSGRIFSPLGRVRSARVTGIGGAALPPAERLPWQEYARRREAWLSPYPHAVYPEDYYRLMTDFGALFLSVPGALAAVNRLEGRAVVSELLCPAADPDAVLPAIAAACPAEQYEVRTPVFFAGPGEAHPYVYIHEPGEALGLPADFWYPFCLE